LRHAFIAAQDVIKEAFLPNAAIILSSDRFSQELLEKLDPISEQKAFAAGYEKMQMIRHNHIATNCDVVFG
jgi:hypothetical protein